MATRASGAQRPGIVLFAGLPPHHESQVENDGDVPDDQSELDLDLYDADDLLPRGADRVVDRAMSLSELPSVLDAADRPSRAAPNLARMSITELHGIDEQHHPVPPTASSRYPRMGANSNRSSVASVSSSSSYPMRDGRHGRQAHVSASASSSASQPRTDMSRPHTTDDDDDEQLGTPHDDYEHLATPPGEPPATLPRPESEPPHGSPLHPAYSGGVRGRALALRPEWMLGLVCIGLGLGIAIKSQEPGEGAAAWLRVFSGLYPRVIGCLTLPMALARALVAGAELRHTRRLGRVGLCAAALFAATALLSLVVAIAIAAAFRPLFRAHAAPAAYRLRAPPFAFQCPNAKFLEQQTDGALQCTGTAINAFTTFPRLVDVEQRLGIDEAVGRVDVQGYALALLDVYFPRNLLRALARDGFHSGLVVALVLGAAVADSASCPRGGLGRSRNPLFGLASHVARALASVLDGAERLAVVATIPILVAAVLALPDLSEISDLAGYYVVAVVVTALALVFVVFPFVFFATTRENPYPWVARALVPACHGFVLEHGLLTLSTAAKVLESPAGGVDPVLVGAVYPLLSVVNRSAFASGLASALLFVGAFGGCAIALDAANVARLVGLAGLASLGDTALARPGMTVFLTTWRVFCPHEDAPPAAVLVAALGAVVLRLGVAVGTVANVLLVQMVAVVGPSAWAPAAAVRNMGAP